MKIVFATNNKNKLAEIRDMLGDKIEVMSLADINCHEDIPETADTLEGNALQKARYVFDKYGMSCFADDTGLEVDALGGEPGVYSARYAGGVGHDSEANMAKLMQKLGDNDNRKARFRTVIALITGSGDDGVKLCGDNGSFSGLYKVGRVPTGDDQNFGNKIMTTLGLASVVYTLGTSDAKIFTVKNVASTNV